MKKKGWDDKIIPRNAIRIARDSFIHVASTLW